MSGNTLCILGCGNLGTAILKSLLNPSETGHQNSNVFSQFTACVRSEASQARLTSLFPEHLQSNTLHISVDANASAISTASATILAVDPSDVEATLAQPDIAHALRSKLVISVAAGWKRDQLSSLISSADPFCPANFRPWVLRTLPNIAALASQSLTAIEDPGPSFPSTHLATATSIFAHVGRAVRVAPRLMAAATAVGGSTPAFFAVICDAMIDAAVAVGVPRATAQTMIYQSMKGTAEMLQSGVHPGVLKDQGTSPEGCTIGGLMVMEEAGVRGHVGRAVREAVTIARAMETGREDLHVNDTRS